ncbi:30S ribosomal protein S10 [Candidatus Cyrtobacter comes]|uniref:Small ribosomal subunit protein uS10 n=1 Tax=Candidatus Cyrtobacter comes TaxID=675776 RepID=A0ABU5L6H0_9RICK|nr:30S ribosomal protein S10 [Candidatus Cyrtobacter comes]MDZ5761721.1 30S ribosomal protein S10 [Candidatus Cyrtobacter comes]
MQQKIRLKLKAVEHRVLDASVCEIVDTVLRAGSRVRGVIPLPSKRKVFTVNRAPSIDKKSREQFEIIYHSRLLIVEASPQAVDAMMKLDIASGVHVEIKASSDGGYGVNSNG